METAGGILTAGSCVLASLECSQNSVLKRKQFKEDKEKRNAWRWTRSASGGWWETKIEKRESFGSPSNPAFLNDKRRCLQISDRQRRGRGIIAGNSKARRLRQLMICITVYFFRLGFHKGKLSYMEFLDNFQDRRSFGVGERVTEYPSHRYNVLHLLIQLRVHCW